MERQQEFRRAERVPGWGSDADPSRRPGVPMNLRPSPRPGVHYDSPPKQKVTIEFLTRAGLDQLTHTYGTGPEPRGMSGYLKRLAYSYPDHMTRKWMFLLMSDRVDVIEGKLGRATAPVLALGVGLGAFLLMKRLNSQV